MTVPARLALIVVVGCGAWAVIAVASSAGAAGYDAYYTCSRPPRSSRQRASPPCDLAVRGWCPRPGPNYPWRAVRRFVYENHGLMRRMYGDERHISVLRSLIDTNDILDEEEKWAKKHYMLIKEEILQEKAVRVPLETTTKKAPVVTTQEPTTTIETMATTDWTTIDTTETSDSTPAEETTTESMTTTRQPASVRPIIFQDTVERPTTTESQIFFRSRGVNACPVKEEVVAPFWANNTRGEVLALLNLYPFEQYVHWERCTYEKKQMFCRQGCRCEQQYRLHRLLAYDPSNDCRGIFSDWFKFPSCCVCKCYDLPPEVRVTSRSPRNAPNATLVDKN